MRRTRQSRLRLLPLVGILITLTALLAIGLTQYVHHSTDAPPKVYWGARIAGATYGYGDPPWDMRSVDAFEAHAGKKISILHWGQPWYLGSHWPHGYYPFVPHLLDSVRQRGAIPMIDWNSWDYTVIPQYDQPRFSLNQIIHGTYDTYIKQWALAAKAWGHPFFLRFNHEMNGDWYPWSEVRNSNSAGQYARAWRHVHDIFVHEGATNVAWVWCVNAEFPGSIPIEGLYPGNAYVDWVAMDGYNSSSPHTSGAKWTSLSDVFGRTYHHLERIAPHKPVMIAETSSREEGGSKATWISDALTRELPKNFPNVKAIVWFNEKQGNDNWPIESSASSQDAFAAGIGTSYYAGADFANLQAPTSLPPL